MRPTAIAGGATSMAGIEETLFIRDEYTVEILFERVSKALAQSLFTYWNTWAKLGETGALTLNVLSFSPDSFEHAQFNTYFSKAKLVAPPFPVEPGRLRHEPMHQARLVCRQQG